jgi:hypothetical protein
MRNLFLISSLLRTWRRSGSPTVRILPHYQYIIRIYKSVTSIVGKSSKNHKGSNMWCHCCDKSSYNKADCREIAKFKQQKKACFEAKARPGKNSLALLFHFEEIGALNRQLKPEKTASSKKRKAESILSPL